MHKCFWWLVVVLVLTLGSCATKENTSGDRLLARVHNKELYLSELYGMFPPEASAEDSILVIQTMVNRWIREAAIEWEAERNLPTDLNIDRLVRDYRTSLIRSNYEQVLVDDLVDTTITEEELTAYYNERQQQFLLERPIIRCYFIKVPYPTPKADSLRALWNNGEVRDTAALADYCDRFAELALLRPEAWYTLDDIASRCPEGTLTANNLQSRQEFTQQDGFHRYYFRFFEKRNRLEVAPLSYVADQVRNMIMHERKKVVLENAREDIFQREMRQENIEIFSSKD
ncbi:MAG: hypothetical protein AAF433_16010 [Bacteroidota bacterium]